MYWSENVQPATHEVQSPSIITRDMMWQSEWPGNYSNF